MGERQVHRVGCVVDAIEVIAGPIFRWIDVQHARLLKFRVARQSRGCTLTEIGKDEAHVFLSRIALDAYLGRERLIFAWLLDALPRGVVFPAMVQAADAIVFHPAAGQLSATMSTAERSNMGCAG